MIPVREQKLIQIVVNNYCEHNCCHCSQMCPLQTKHYNMPLEQVEQALQTLESYPGHIGCFGGNPLLHPQFPEICKLYQKYVPVKLRRELWCSGKNYDKHKTIIKETFYDEAVAYNEHEEQQPCWHQPVNIAIDEVFDLKTADGFSKITKCIENCWVQQRWSAAITPMGAYFCEIASARAWLLGEPKGLPVEKDWWKKDLWEFAYQKRALCYKCSACLPMPMKPNDDQPYDDVSPRAHLLLRCSKKRPVRHYDLDSLREFYKDHTFEPETEYRKRGGFKDFKDWTPWQYRSFEDKSHSPEDSKKNRKRKQNEKGINNNSYKEQVDTS